VLLTLFFTALFTADSTEKMRRDFTSQRSCKHTFGAEFYGLSPADTRVFTRSISAPHTLRFICVVDPKCRCFIRVL